MAEVETKWAVVELGGKQHLVAVGVHLLVNQVTDEVGSTLTTSSLLGPKTPVILKVLSHQRGPKIRGLKFKNKVRYLKHYGHRQNLTTLEVTAIGVAKVAEAKIPAAKPTALKATKPIIAKATRPAAQKPAAKKPAAKKTAKEQN